VFLDRRFLRAGEERIAHAPRSITRAPELGSRRASMLKRCVFRHVRSVEAIRIAERELLAVERCARAREALLERVERGRGGSERGIRWARRRSRYSHTASPGASIKLCRARALAATGGRGAQRDGNEHATGRKEN
jgi:hypothetical protein